MRKKLTATIHKLRTQAKKKWKHIRPRQPTPQVAANQRVKARSATKQKNRTIVKIGAVVFLAIFALFFYILILNDLPSPTKLNSQTFPTSTLIYDRHGTLLYEIFADRNRTPIEIETLPEYVKQATIAIEDQNFYQHFGFSVQGIVRAAKNTIFKSKLQGGSTITQQLIKTTLLSPERTLQRKAREAVLTIAAEILYSKDEILEMYLNHIPYGGTAYGIESAAQRFFNKPASQLTLPEASLLVGLPQAPTRYSPFTNPESAKARQYEVLRRMSEDGYISQAEADQAFQVDLNFAAPATNINAPHFVFYIKSLLEEKYGIQTVERGGLRVTTSLDLDVQQYAQASLSAEINQLERFKVSNGAALVTKPNTGEILAMIGSRDFFNDDIDGKVNITTRLRQPGSSIKPINYVTALQTQRLHPASVLLDIPTCFQVTGQPNYCPKNYDGSFHGPVSFRQALANSYNIPAVKVLAVNGLESMIATASAMGIQSFKDPSQYGLSLTLGGGEVTMLDMATAFGTLANQGVRVTLQPILKIEDQTGKVLEEHQPDAVKTDLEYFFSDHNNSNQVGVERNGLVRALNREPAYLISNILADNNARSSAFGANSQLRITDKEVSVKTGTTNDLRDNWTIGYTPEYLTATWVGNNDNSPMNPYVVSGVTGAAPVWHDIMEKVISDSQAVQPEPSDIESQSICATTGSLSAEGIECDSRLEYFWTQFLPQQFNSIKKGIWVHKDTGIPAFFGDQPEEEPENLDNLEAQEHIVISDPFVKEFCLDCAWPQGTDEAGNPDGKISYPQTTINLSDFYQNRNKPIEQPFSN